MSLQRFKTHVAGAVVNAENASLQSMSTEEAPREHTGATPRPHLGYTSATPRLYFVCTSAGPHCHLEPQHPLDAVAVHGGRAPRGCAALCRRHARLGDDQARPAARRRHAGEITRDYPRSPEVRHVQQHGGVTLAHEHVLRAKGGGTDGHSTSGLKFRLLVPWLKVGCNVLLSDVDVVYLRDPFQSSPPLLHRDSDVEATRPRHLLDTS